MEGMNGAKKQKEKKRKSQQIVCKPEKHHTSSMCIFTLAPAPSFHELHCERSSLEGNLDCDRLELKNKQTKIKSSSKRLY